MIRPDCKKILHTHAHTHSHTLTHSHAHTLTYIHAPSHTLMHSHTHTVHELLDSEQKSTGLSSDRIVLGEYIIM